MFGEQGDQVVSARYVHPQSRTICIEQLEADKRSDFEHETDGTGRVAFFDLLERRPRYSGTFRQIVLGPFVLLASEMDLLAEEFCGFGGVL